MYACINSLTETIEPVLCKSLNHNALLLDFYNLSVEVTKCKKYKEGKISMAVRLG